MGEAAAISRAGRQRVARLLGSKAVDPGGDKIDHGLDRGRVPLLAGAR